MKFYVPNFQKDDPSGSKHDSSRTTQPYTPVINQYTILIILDFGHYQILVGFGIFKCQKNNPSGFKPT